MVVLLKLLKKIKHVIGGPMDPFVWYSGPTDTTGKLVAEALKAAHGKRKPANKKDTLCICWGCKTDKAVNMGTMPVLNHPDKIKANRHKYNTLRTLHAAGVYVGNFCSAQEIERALDNPAGDETMAIPVIGRKNYHQGGKDFHTCLTKGHVKKAIAAGAMYFRNYMDVKFEYRLHVFQGAVINSQKKVERKNLGQAFADQHGERIKHNAVKKGVKLDEDTLSHTLKDLGGRQGHANQIIKSNTKGWKFSQVKLSNVSKDLQDLAVRAVVAAGLDFAAVDCVILDDGRAAIIELNTGPGLTGTPFDAYVGAFKEVLKPKKVTATAQSTKNTTSKSGNKVKVDSDKLRMLADMLDVASTDQEKAVLNNTFKKMFG